MQPIDLITKFKYMLFGLEIHTCNQSGMISIKRYESLMQSGFATSVDCSYSNTLYKVTDDNDRP